MRLFETKEFARFRRRERISDEALCDAAARAERGLIGADLGSGLIKQRVARPGQGRSGGYRTLIVYRAGLRSVFVYGFAKSERDNIGVDELAFWKKIASAYLAMKDVMLEQAKAAGELKEVICDEEGENE